MRPRNVLPVVLFLCHSAVANDQREWVAAKFLAQSPGGEAAAQLLPLGKTPAPEKNTRRGWPLRIGQATFKRGFNMPGPGEIEVRLPAPAQRFAATVGVDSNDAGYYANAGRGSVVASVEVQGREVFRSAVLREGLAGVSIDVPLNGARAFTLRLTAVGEHSRTWQREWDNANWADARVTLNSGRTLHLEELPVGPLPAAFTAGVPFSFRYDGRGSDTFLSSWEVRRTQQGNRHTITWSDPKTKLAIRLSGIAYGDFPVVEWTLYFKNEGAAPTPIIEDIQALDAVFERSAGGEFVLHHSEGSPNSPTDYRPLEDTLKPGSKLQFGGRGGRATDKDLGFFNLAQAGRGMIVSVGWPAQWAATFERDTARGVRIRAGFERVHFHLLPGEEIRSPLIALQFWEGDWIDGQNAFRRWMMAHNLPRLNGKLPPPQLAGGSNRHTIEMQDANEANQLEFLKRDLDAGLPLDYWWMDAGWYPSERGWPQTGTWIPDPVRFPRGFKPISDAARARGVKTLVWFEPERVAPGTQLAREHPGWLIGPDGKDKLLYLGNPEAWHWLVEHVSALLREQGIGLYRQDFNFAPLTRFESNDTPGRQGITEIKHTMGYLAYWDELRRRFPNMLIDTCASGGRRNDLETLRRSVPLWRSDFAFQPMPMQQFTYGMALWIPYFGTGVNSLDPYVFRSQMTPAVGIGLEPGRQPNGYARFKQLVSQWRAIAPLYYGDFYPLTPYSAESTAWQAWQFNAPERGEGMLQIFRRPDSPFDHAQFKLRGLNAAARYVFTDIDSGKTSEYTGAQLMREGLPVAVPVAPSAPILRYRRK